MNKWYIGQKVRYSENGRSLKGKIIDIVDNFNFPLQVEFENNNFESFNLSGQYDSISDQSLFPLFDKKGTPEARRIVAMLASDYRKCVIHSNNHPNSLVIMGIYKNIYKKAKAMLGE